MSLSFHNSFASAEAAYYSDAARERLSLECERHDGHVRYECALCEEEQAEALYETHDWRRCSCEGCYVIYAEYEREMGE